MPKTEQKAPKTIDAVKILDRMIGDDSQLRHLANEAMVNAEVAQRIYEVRTKSKLTQKQLADLVQTSNYRTPELSHGVRGGRFSLPYFGQ